jgi:Na+/phosphate symporter
MESNDFSSQHQLQEMQTKAVEIIERMNKNLIKRLKRAEVGTRSSIFYLSILNETKNLIFQVVNLYKSQRDFSNYNNENGRWEAEKII